ncbi:hydrocephalus-inducing protein homolog [Phaenicophaeus curvirostris]|uniref:hydrocephalus-inducing protein homolog n=1 Tax=Phaenicophaeus curvirostris TaxID=33595 RepID=UPI0037F0EC7E
MFNKVAEAEVTLRNSGKMGFTYAVLSPSVATAGCLQPREPLVLPSTVLVGGTSALAALDPGCRALCLCWRWSQMLQVQMEQMLVEEHTLEQLKALASGPPEDTACDQHAYRGLLKAELPEYILDFGYVILGSFRVQPDHVEDLPCSETESFKVHFDPESASLPLGEVDVPLPIEVAEGPMFHVRLRANVTMPSLCLSKDRLDFSAVPIGQCQEETVQFHNQLQVPCEWFITISEPVEKVKNCVPRNVDKKLLQELNSKPRVFTALPLSGALSPGQGCNVQVRFSPTEEKSYKNILQINICQSSRSLQLQVSGHGLEPRLEFSPTVLELGPLMPCSCGVEGTVVVKNPCNFHIEFYSLEFDQEYLEEEEILRMLKDYDCQNTLLLPPRAPGEKLPLEVLQYYQDQKRLQGEQTKTKTGEPAGQANAEQQQSTTGSKEAAGEQDDSPVYRAIARHLGIDISAEGRAAQKRRGVVVIVHGAPLTGKTSAAIALSKYYGAACLSVDAVVTEAISDKWSLAGLRARKLSMAATSEQSHKETDSSNRGADVSFWQRVSVEAKHSLNASQSISKGSLRPVRSKSRWAPHQAGGRGMATHPGLRKSIKQIQQVKRDWHWSVWRTLLLILRIRES